MTDPADAPISHPLTEAAASGPTPPFVNLTDVPLDEEPRTVISPPEVMPPHLVRTEEATGPALESAFGSTPMSSTARRRRGIPSSLWLLAVLIPYAIVTSVGVIYLLQLQQTAHRPAHILESIPDQGLYEDFLDGRRREAASPLGQGAEKPPPAKVIPANEALDPDTPPLQLGETRRVGDLAVTPVDVTRQMLRYDYKGGQRQVAGEEALVLQLRVKNEGRLIFRPDDETFNRAYLDDNRVPVYTYLQAGSQRFYGAVTDPTQERVNSPHCGQLLPGESGTIHVTAVREADGRTAAASVLRGNEPLLWRVQVRRGKEEITLTNGRKRSVWVTSVIAVSFTHGQVKQVTQ
jgi:hypothetical protein